MIIEHAQRSLDAFISGPDLIGQARSQVVGIDADKLDEIMWDKGFVLVSSGKRNSPLFEYIPVSKTPLSEPIKLIRQPYVADRPVSVYRGDRQLENYFSDTLNILPFAGGNDHEMVVLRAMRRSGATTLLYRYLDDLKDRGVISVYINMIIFEREKSYSAGEMLGLLAKRITSRIREDYHGKGVEQLKPTKDEIDPEEFRQFMRRARKIVGDKLVMIFDDADVLGEDALAKAPAPKIFPSDDVEKIFTSLYGNDIPVVLRTGDNLGTGWTDQLRQITQDRAIEHRMRLLTRIEVDALVRPPQAPFRYKQEAISELYSTTGGHPALTQFVASAVIRQWCNRKTDDVAITVQHVKEAVEEITRDPDYRGYFNYIITYSLPAGARAVLERLTQAGAISNEDFSIDIAKVQPGEKIEIERLEKVGILGNTDGRLRLNIGIFAPFLKPPEVL